MNELVEYWMEKEANIRSILTNSLPSRQVPGGMAELIRARSLGKPRQNAINNFQAAKANQAHQGVADKAREVYQRANQASANNQPNLLKRIGNRLFGRRPGQM